MMYVLLLALVGASINAHAAGRVLYDDFEDGTTNKWGVDGGRSRCPVVTAPIDGLLGVKAGTHMVQCNYQTDGNWSNITIGNFDSLYTDEFFVRMWYRPDTDLSRVGGFDGVPSVGQAGFKFMRFFQFTPYHDMFEVAGHPQNANNNAGNPNDGEAFPTYWGDAVGDNTNLSNAWHKLEYYMRQSTGSFKVWHDGILIRNDTGYSYAGGKWTDFFLQSNGTDGIVDNSNHWYADEFEVYSDTGTGATGLMSDATITQGGGGGGGGIDSSEPVGTRKFSPMSHIRRN